MVQLCSNKLMFEGGGRTELTEGEERGYERAQCATPSYDTGMVFHSPNY